MPQAEQPPVPRARSHGFARLLTAVAAGLAGGLVAPLLYPAVARGARPAARKVLIAGIAAFEHGREAAARLGEHASDLMAEAQAEYDEQHKPAPSDDPPLAASEIVRLRGSGRETTGA